MSIQKVETLCFDTADFPKNLSEFKTFNNSEGMKCVEVIDFLRRHDAFANMRRSQKTLLNHNAFMNKRITTLEAQNKVLSEKVARMQK